MRRFFIAFFCVSIVISPAFAQARLGDFTMRGNASQEMKNEGFSAAHPSLPLNSKVKITNPRNGKEIEVTVIDRIIPSQNRIIDLSLPALQALGMRAGESVIITVSAPPRPAAQAQRQEGPIVELSEPRITVQPAGEQKTSETATVQTAENKNPAINETAAANPPLQAVVEEKDAEQEKKLQQPFNFTVNTYVNGTDDKSAQKDAAPANNTEFLAWLMTMSIDAREAREARESREFREARESRELREAMERASSAQQPPQNIIINPQPVVSPQPVINTQPIVNPQPVSSADSNQPAQSSDMSSAKQASSPAQFPVPVRNVQAVSVSPSPVSADAMQIIPSLPDRNSDKVYRLQVAAYSGADSANRASEFIRSAGFNVEQEYTGSMFRVLVTGISSPDVYPALVRLGSLGFGQIWVRE